MYYFGRYKTNLNRINPIKSDVFVDNIFLLFEKSKNIEGILKKDLRLTKLQYVDKKIFKVGLNLIKESKKIFERTKSPLRGFSMKEYILRSNFYWEKNLFYEKMKRPNNILSEAFYLNIADMKTNKMLINYINKNFYVKYSIDNTMVDYKKTWHYKAFGLNTVLYKRFTNKIPSSSMANYVIDKSEIVNYIAQKKHGVILKKNPSYILNMIRYFDEDHKKIITTPDKTKKLIKKQYIENIFNLYKKEEQLILNFILYRDLIDNLKNIGKNTLNSIEKILNIFYKTSKDFILFYKEASILLSKM